MDIGADYGQFRDMPPRKRNTPKPNAISRYREAANLTQPELADIVATSKETIYRLEQGKIKLNMDWAERLAPHLNCEPAALFDKEPPIEQTLRSLGLPVEPKAIFRPMAMLRGIGELIQAGAFTNAATAARTLTALLLEMARQREGAIAEDEIKPDRQRDR